MNIDKSKLITDIETLKYCEKLLEEIQDNFYKLNLVKIHEDVIDGIKDYKIYLYHKQSALSDILDSDD